METSKGAGIPKHWVEAKLTEIADYDKFSIVDGPFGSDLKLTDYVDYEGVPVLTTKNISPNWDPVGIRYISHDKFEQLKRSMVKPGDILIAKIGSIGKATIYPNNAPVAIIPANLCKISVNSKIAITSYIFQYIVSQEFQEKLKEITSATAMPAFSVRKLKELSIPLPPLNEQKRIVEKLDAILPKVKSAKARLEKIPAILKKFRQSVLAAACSGRLTEDWREGNSAIIPANELLILIEQEKKKRYLELCIEAEKKGKRKPKDYRNNKRSKNITGDLPTIPYTWCYSRLENLCFLVTDGTHKTPKYVKNGKPFLSVKNVRPFLIKDEDIKYITNEEFKEINSRCNPEFGDILYTKVGTYGYAAINSLNYDFSIFVSLALLKPVQKYFTSKYAECVMNSEIVFAQARERVTGIGTPDLHLIEIRDFSIPLPPLEEQHEIVRRVEKLFGLADSLEDKYKKALARVEKLEQAILAKAFRGELVEPDPNDLPAAELLKQILAEKAKLEAGKKSKKPRARKK